MGGPAKISLKTSSGPKSESGPESFAASRFDDDRPGIDGEAVGVGPPVRAAGRQR